MKAQPKLDLVTALRDTKYAPVAEELQKEFNAAGITSRDNLHNAPLKVKTTYGADIYEVMKILDDRAPVTIIDASEDEPSVAETVRVMPLVPPTVSKKGRK